LKAYPPARPPPNPSPQTLGNVTQALSRVRHRPSEQTLKSLVAAADRHAKARPCHLREVARTFTAMAQLGICTPDRSDTALYAAAAAAAATAVGVPRVQPHTLAHLAWALAVADCLEVRYTRATEEGETCPWLDGGTTPAHMTRADAHHYAITTTTLHGEYRAGGRVHTPSRLVGAPPAAAGQLHLLTHTLLSHIAPLACILAAA